jgi:adenine deaminase
MSTEARNITGNVVDVHSRQIYPGVVTVVDGRIETVERSAGSLQEGPASGNYILPGFIDAHVHVESSMLVPSQFARLAVRHGTVATLSDPHEIANVLGVPGVHYMTENGKQVPFKFFFGAPSCVPATGFESSGAQIGPEQVDELLSLPEIRYLSEVMNFPGVLVDDPEVMAKLGAAKKRGKPIDGHAPGLRGEELRKYVAAGISTDHESLDVEEAREKLELGMKILIREGSASLEFDMLKELIDEYPELCMFCSDDKHPTDLVKGHINDLVRRAVASGLDLFNVLRAACVNPVEHYDLDVGLLREGDPADFIVVADLQDFDVVNTFIGGELVAADGTPLFNALESDMPNVFRTGECEPSNFTVRARPGKMRVIEVLDGQLFTKKMALAPTVVEGLAVADTDRDVLKIAVINRYEKAPAAVGFIRNMGLQAGAIASTVAHDSHNIVVVGTNDDDMARAVNMLVETEGGLAAAAGEEQFLLALPVAGLMSISDGFDVAEAYDVLDQAAKRMGSRLKAPFMTLSFMALLVIPELKISDEGLFDGTTFQFTDLFTG